MSDSKARIKIKDLEKFVLEQIVRPYQNIAGWGDKRCEKFPLSMTDLACMLTQDSEWSRLVIDRIRMIRFAVPTWVKHPIVNVLFANNAIAFYKEKMIDKQHYIR